jgi:hypothetical protein
MSRSYAKRIKFGNSDKKDKKLAHKAHRAMERQVLSKIEQDYIEELDIDAELEFANEKVTSDVWGFSSDGTSGMYVNEDDMKLFGTKYDKKTKLIRK